MSIRFVRGILSHECKEFESMRIGILRMNNFTEWIKENIGYCIFVGILAVLLFLCVQDLIPGHLYFGPSENIRYNQPTNVIVSKQADWQTEFVNDSQNLWGVSLRFELSKQDQQNNRKRTSRALINVKKDIEEPARDAFAENIEITMSRALESGAEEQLGKWTVSVEEIRPQSDYKLVWVQPIENMQGAKIILHVATGLEEERAFQITNAAPIQMRVHYNTIKMLMYLFAAFMLIGSILLAKCLDYAKAWLVFGCIFALVWFIAVPYARVPDEETHFFRIYEITQGHMLTDSGLDGEEQTLGRRMPDNLDMDIRQHFSTFRDVIDHRNLVLDRENEVWYSFPNMALYSPISYLPQVIGVFLTDLITDNVLSIVYMGRLFGLLAALFLFYHALKRLPVKRECMFMILMLPMVFQEMISLSADSFINALSLFLTGFSLSLICDFSESGSRKITRKELTVLWIIAPVMGLCKVVYIPLCFLLLLLPVGLFDNKRRKLLHTVGPVAVAMILNVLWTAVGNIGESASHEQIAFILEYPYAFIKIAYRTLLTFGHDVIMEFMGSNMGGLNISVYELPLLFLLGVIVVLAVAPQSGDKRFDRKHKIWMTAIWMAILAMTWGSMYLGYNEVANNLITGFQGRYLIPIAFLMLVTLETDLFERKKADIRKWLYPLAVSANLYVLFFVVEEMTW